MSRRRRRRDESARSPAPPAGSPAAGDRFIPFSLPAVGWDWVWPYGALAAVILMVMAPVWTSLDRVLGDDVLLQHYPFHVLLRTAVAEGRFPFWNPYTFSGMPAFANPLAGYAYPPHLVTLVIPAVPALNITFAGHVVLAGCATAWCAGRLGAPLPGQFLAGAAYGMGSAMAQRLWPGHLPLLEAAAWLPVATGAAISIETRRSFVLLSGSLGMVLLSGRADIFVFAGWWLVPWAVLGRSLLGPRQAALRLLRLAAAGGIAAGLAAVQLLPSAAMLAVSNRQAGLSWESQTLASLPLWHLLTLLSPVAFGSPEAKNYWGGETFEWHERLAFVGVVPLAAAALVRGRWRWVLAGLAAVSLALALGRYAPWYGWVVSLPGYSSYRVPSRHLVLLVLAASLAAGLGLPHLRSRRVAVTLLGSAVGVFLAGLTAGIWLPAFIGALGGLGDGPGPGAPQITQTATGLTTAAVALGAAGACAFLPAPVRTAAVIMVAVAELGFLLAPFRANLFDPASFVAQGNPIRGAETAAVLGRSSAMLSQLGPVLGVTQPAGYDPAVSHRYASFLLGRSAPDAVSIPLARADNPVLPLLGVARVWEPGNPPTRPEVPPKPPAWVAGCAWPGDDPVLVWDPSFPRLSCVITPSVGERQSVTPPRDAEVLERRPGYLKARAQGPGWLVTTLPWYPGWSVSGAGQQRPTEILDGALVGATLPPGEQVVEFSYFPEGLAAGAGISVAALVVLAGLTFAPALRHRCSPHPRDGGRDRPALSALTQTAAAAPTRLALRG